MTLITDANLKTVLGIPTGVTFHDGAVTLAVDYANDRVLRAIGQSSLAATTATEYPNVYGHGQFDVDLEHFPVVSVVAVTNGGSAVPVADYRVVDDIGRLRLTQGNIGARGQALASWSAAIDGVVVTYTYGYTSATVPEELRRAALLIAEFSYSRGGLRGRSHMRNRSLTLDLDKIQLPREVLSILSRYESAFHP